MKARKRKSTSSIAYNYDATGYLVQLCVAGEIVDEYRAGNSPYESTGYLPVGDPAALPREKIRQLARKEALRLAEEHDVPESAIEIDDDIVVSETEHELVEG